MTRAAGSPKRDSTDLRQLGTGRGFQHVAVPADQQVIEIHQPEHGAVRKFSTTQCADSIAFGKIMRWCGQHGPASLYAGRSHPPISICV